MVTRGRSQASKSNSRVSQAPQSEQRIALYRKYRPKIFADIVGQPHIVELLRAEVSHAATSHAYIFIGPRGTGKTSTARILAKALNCHNIGVNGDPCNRCDVCVSINNGSFVDLIEIDAASNRGIDNIRELQERIAYPPSYGKKKVYIIDEVHMLTKEAFNALLKTLEEPPKHVVFILATTEPHKVPETIMSRCERLDFHLADQQTLLQHLYNIAKLEGIDLDEGAAKLLVEQARGSFRDLLTLLDSVYAVDSHITEQLVRNTLRLPDDKLVRTILYGVFGKDFDLVTKTLALLEKQGTNMSTLLSDLVRVTRDTLLTEPALAKERQYIIKLIGRLFAAFDSVKVVFDPVLLVESTLHSFMLDLPGPIHSIRQYMYDKGVLNGQGQQNDVDGSVSAQNSTEGFSTPSSRLSSDGPHGSSENGALETTVSLTHPEYNSQLSEGERVEGDTRDSGGDADSVSDMSATDADKGKPSEVLDIPGVGQVAKLDVPADALYQEFKRELKKTAPAYLYSYLLNSKLHRVEGSQAGVVLTIKAPDYTFYRQKTKSAGAQSVLNTALRSALRILGYTVENAEVRLIFDKGLNGARRARIAGSRVGYSQSGGSSEDNMNVRTGQNSGSNNREGGTGTSKDRPHDNQKSAVEGGAASDIFSVFGGDLEPLS